MQFIDKIALYRFCNNFIYQLPHGDPSEKVKTQALLRIFSFESRRQFSSWTQLLPCVLQQKTFWGAVIHCRVFKHRPFLTSFQPCLKSELFSFTTFSLKSVTVQTTRNRKCKWLERSTRENSDLRMNCVCEVSVNLHSKVSKRLIMLFKKWRGWGRRGRERGWWCLHSSSKLVEKILIVIYISYTDE